MKKLFFILFTLCLLIASCYKLFAQETRMTHLCHLGATRIDVYLKYLEGEYYLYTYLIKDEAFYIDKGSNFSLITSNKDTLHLKGMYESQSELLENDRRAPLTIVIFGALNKYELDPNQIEFLKSNELKTVSITTSDGITKLDITDNFKLIFRELFEKLDKKVQKHSKSSK